jgi:hypothetical protein
VSGASFEVSGRPGTDDCKVKLNGEEIQNCLQNLTIRGDGRDMTYHVELDVLVIEGMTFHAQWANVQIPDKTRDLLIKLGWTPPAD